MTKLFMLQKQVQLVEGVGWGLPSSFLDIVQKCSGLSKNAIILSIYGTT